MTIGKRSRKDFPIFSRKVNGHRLAYLDNAATSQRPRAVLNAMREFDERHNANPGRGMHTLGAEATEAYDEAREKVARFIGAKAEEIIFTRNTTESLNLLSYSLPAVLSPQAARPIALSKMEHHSNLVPWQQMAKREKRGFAFVPFEIDKPITTNQLANLKSASPPALFTFAHASNALGTIQDAGALIRYAHEEWDCPVVVDAAQSAPHMKIDVRRLGCDFLAFSGHKMLGPMGIGVLYMAGDWMARLPPFLTGGGQIGKVEDLTSTWAEGPAKFEAGTPNAGGAIGLAAATDYLDKAGLDKIAKHEHKLMQKTLDEIGALGGVKTYGLSSAGVLLGPLGTGALFFINGVSFLAVLLALMAMRDVRTHSHSSACRSSPLLSVQRCGWVWGCCLSWV